MNIKRFLFLGSIIPVTIISGALFGINPVGLVILTVVVGFAVAKMYLGFEKKEPKESIDN